MRNVMDGKRPPVPAGTSKQLEKILSGCWAQKVRDRLTIQQVLRMLAELQEMAGVLQ
jgi:hypothetical protein